MDREQTAKVLADGPQPIESSKRRGAVNQIVSRLDAVFGDSIVAIGLYGSTGRSADRAYSDIEMFCALRESGVNRRFEWADGGGKYELELFGEDVVRGRAAQLDETWPITHAAYVNPQRLRGDSEFFADLRRLVFDHPDSRFHDAIRAIIVGELYEGLGKVRNSVASGAYQTLPRVAMRIALMAELMVGLAHRHVYTATGLATAESMLLTPRPSGHDELCQVVMKGELSNPSRIAEVIERYWKSVIDWTARQNIDLSSVSEWPL